MKLDKFSVSGFRSLKEVTWKPEPLNVLIGPNNSGKSNFLHSLELLQEATTGDLDKAVLREGGIGALLWDGQSREIKWQINVSPYGLTQYRGDIEWLQYELTLAASGFLNNYQIESENLMSARPGKLVSLFVRDARQAELFDEKTNKIKMVEGRFSPVQTVMSQTSAMFSSSDVVFFQNYLKSWGIYRDLLLHQTSEVRKAAITRRESQLSPDGQNLITFLHTLYSSDRSFRSDFNDAMRAAFGKEYEELEFPPAEDQRIQMRIRWKSLQVARSTVDLSEGTLKFMMLLAILLNKQRGQLIAVDEPETYLHPSMFPILADLASEAANSSQIVFTTHSPEFLSALGSHNPQTTVMQNLSGETKLSILDEAELKRWLEKYKLGELFVSGDLEALA